MTPQLKELATKRRLVIEQCLEGEITETECFNYLVAQYRLTKFEATSMMAMHDIDVSNIGR